MSIKDMEIEKSYIVPAHIYSQLSHEPYASLKRNSLLSSFDSPCQNT
jgi:hypothetical protein